jgi:phosphoheptose isomerase
MVSKELKAGNRILSKENYTSIINFREIIASGHLVKNYSNRYKISRKR